MNVLKFSIDVTTKKFTKKECSVYKKIESAYCKIEGKESEEYNNNIKAKWTNMQCDNLKNLFHMDSLVISSQVKRISYYIFRINSGENHENASFDVLIQSTNGDIDHSVNTIIYDIKKRLRCCKLKIDIIQEEGIYLYIYNKSSKDIQGSNYKLKANFIPVNKIDKTDWIHSLLMLAICILISYILISDETNIDIKSIFLSIIASVVVTPLSMLMLLIVKSIKGNKLKVSIIDLSNFIRNDIDLPIGSDEDINNLQQPNIGWNT